VKDRYLILLFPMKGISRHFGGEFRINALSTFSLSSVSFFSFHKPPKQAQKSGGTV